MKMRLLLALVGLAVSFAPPAFAQPKDKVDPETARQVRALASNYDAAFNRQDAVTVAGLYATVVNEAIAAENEVRATGTWSDTFEEPSTGTIYAEGTYSWVLLHEGDTWRIRESTYDITNMRH